MSHADLTFLMGKFPAVLPGDCAYTRTHMWCRPEQGRWRFGFTSYAIRLMQDVYFLDWHVNPGDPVKHLQDIGHIETSKAVVGSSHTISAGRCSSAIAIATRWRMPPEN